MVGFAVGEPNEASPVWKWIAAATAAAVFAVSVGRLIYLVRKLYRCPACGAVVMEAMDGVPFNPEVCPECGVRLRS